MKFSPSKNGFFFLLFSFPFLDPRNAAAAAAPVGASNDAAPLLWPSEK